MAAGGYLAVRFVLASARGVYLADSFYLTMLTMSKVLLQYLTLLGSNSCIITSSVLAQKHLSTAGTGRRPCRRPLTQKFCRSGDSGDRGEDGR